MLDTIDVFGFRRPEATRVMTDMLKSTLSCTILKPGRGRCRELGEGLGRTGVQAWCLQGSGVKGCAWSLAVCDFFEVFADTKRPAVCVCVCAALLRIYLPLNTNSPQHCHLPSPTNTAILDAAITTSTIPTTTIREATCWPWGSQRVS